MALATLLVVIDAKLTDTPPRATHALAVLCWPCIALIIVAGFAKGSAIGLAEKAGRR